MNKFRMILWTVVGILAMSAVAFAQPEAAGGTADNASTVASYKAIAAGIGFAIAAGLGALGQGKIAAAAAEGAARNPGAASKIQTIMILGLALIESLVLFMLLVVFAVLR